MCMCTHTCSWLGNRENEEETKRKIKLNEDARIRQIREYMETHNNQEPTDVFLDNMILPFPDVLSDDVFEGICAGKTGTFLQGDAFDLRRVLYTHRISRSFDSMICSVPWGLNLCKYTSLHIVALMLFPTSCA